ncbi:MAG TPA: hypothetical protein PKC27_06075, partial [Methanomethylovorans sp.]|nr:hypothetical protein [Methanomethylovorans sp.]
GNGEKECHYLPGKGDNNWNLILHALDKAAYELGIKEYCKEDRKKFSMVFEATPNANTITEGMIAERCLVSTPGIPCGLPQEVGRKYRVDLVMEPLFIGVTSMLYSVI